MLLYVSFQNHRWIQTGVIIQKCSIWVKIHDSFVPRDLKICRMTLQISRAPVLCYFKLCASFCCHRWIKTGVLVQFGNDRFGLKLTIFCPGWPWNLNDDLEKQQGISSMLLQALWLISLPLVNSNWSYYPETLNSGQNWRFYCPVWSWKLANNLEKQ